MKINSILKITTFSLIILSTLLFLTGCSSDVNDNTIQQGNGQGLRQEIDCSVFEDISIEEVINNDGTNTNNGYCRCYQEECQSYCTENPTIQFCTTLNQKPMR